MDFFGYQEQARKRTIYLIVLFALAVICIIFAINVFVAAALHVAYSDERTLSGYPSHHVRQSPPFSNAAVFFWVSIISFSVILVVSIFKIYSLSEGGMVIAEMLGGRYVNPYTSDPTEKRLLNVVTEMAIASGIPVPPVYILDNEDGINAFVAGYDPGNAVIAVTKGSLNILTRDELQGVIAHEYSHILNSDTRLDIRIIGVLSGILAFATAGYYLTRGSFRVRDWRIAIGGSIIGMALIIIGYTGVFFSRIIKCAISRQREYLADASAVQFTRNPGGLAGALKKIGKSPDGSKIRHYRAEEMSHIFFATGISGWLDSLFNTHPPLTERIRRIKPSFNGGFLPVVEEHDGRPVDADILGFHPAGQESSCAGSSDTRPSMDFATFAASIGKPHYENLACARQTIASIPPEIIEATRKPLTAALLAWSLHISEDPEVREKQLSLISASLPASPLQQNNTDMTTALSAIPKDPVIRFLLADMAIASLKGLSLEQYNSFRETTNALFEMDNKVTLFEYMLQNMIIRNVDKVFSPPKQQRVYYQSITSLLPHYTKLISTLSYYGTADRARAEFAFETAKMRAGIKEPITLLPYDETGVAAVRNALNVLNAAAPKIKRLVLESAASCVFFDGNVTIEEAELLRCIADALDCPVPPILPGALQN